MTDYERIDELKERLAALELRIPSRAERAIVEVARECLHRQIGELGQRMSRRDYWRTHSRFARVG